MSKTEEKLDPEQEERIRKFEEKKAVRNKELGNVVKFLMDQVGLKTHKGILNQHFSCEYFRGVNFHLAVLSHEKLIMKMLPSFVEDKSITQLKTIDDSIKLGMNMIIYENIVQLRGDPRIMGQSTMKQPKYVTNE
jgi:hypothetical protein